MRNKRKFLEWILHHRLPVTIAIVVLAVLICLSPLALARTLPICSEGGSRMDLAVAASQILSAVFVIAGTVIAVWQYYVSTKGQSVKMQTEKVQKAFELSQYYKDEILDRLAAVKHVYRKCGIIAFAEPGKNRFSDFDQCECEEIFGQNNLQRLEQIKYGQSYYDAIKEANALFDLHLDGRMAVGSTFDEREKYLFAFWADVVVPLMNNLEYFASYFTHNVADESVIYESLKPTYFEACRMLYFDISKCSEPGKPQLYRNLTRLYATWAKREAEERARTQNRCGNPGTIPETLH